MTADIAASLCSSNRRRRRHRVGRFVAVSRLLDRALDDAFDGPSQIRHLVAHEQHVFERSAVDRAAQRRRQEEAVRDDFRRRAAARRSSCTRTATEKNTLAAMQGRQSGARDCGRRTYR